MSIVEGGEMDVSQKRTMGLEIIYKKLLEGVKIWIYPNAYIHWTHIYIEFSKMYIFLKIGPWKLVQYPVQIEVPVNI